MPCAPPVTRATFPWRIMLLTAGRMHRALLYVGVQSEGGVLMSTTTVNTDGQVSFYKLSFTPKRWLLTILWVSSLKPSAAVEYSTSTHTYSEKMNALKWTIDKGCFYKHLYFSVFLRGRFSKPKKELYTLHYSVKTVLCGIFQLYNC